MPVAPILDDPAEIPDTHPDAESMLRPGPSEEREMESRFHAGSSSSRYHINTLIGKKVVYVDSQIYTTTNADKFRLELKNLWKISDEGELNIRPINRLKQYPPIGTFDPAAIGSYLFFTTNQSRKISEVLIATDQAHKINNTFYDKRVFPIRIVGQPNEFQTDEQWKTYIVGGSYNNVDMPGIIPDYQIADHYHHALLPMTEQQLNKYNIGDTKIKFFADFNMEYHIYKPKYESNISGLNEITLPNYYALLASSLVDVTKTSADDYRGTVHLDYVLDEETGEERLAPVEVVHAGTIADMSYPMYIYANVPFYRHATLNRVIDSGLVGRMFKEGHGGSDVSAIKRLTKQEKTMNEYLDVYANNAKNVTRHNSKIFSHFKNVFFNTTGVDEYLKPMPDRNKHSKLFPMNINLKFKTENSGLFVKLLNDCDLVGKFMTGIYQGFAKRSNKYEIRKRKFVEMTENPIEKIDEEGFPYNVFELKNNTKDLKFLNVFDWWNESYKSGGVEKEIAFIGRATESVKIATDKPHRYRFENTAKHLKFASLFRKFLEVKFAATNRDYLDLIKGKQSYVETVLYRIIKRGGTPTGPNRRTPVIQNIWIMNSPDLDVLDFFDTQVHYDKKYRYDIIAYKLIVGAKYRYKDLRISKRISGTNAGGLDALGNPIEETCLSFFDPETGDHAQPLASFGTRTPTSETLITSTGTHGSSTDPLTEYSVDEVSAMLGLTVPSYIKLSPNPFVADANIELEPSVEIVEVPLFAYNGHVIENAPARPAIEPFMIENMEKTMAFRIRFDEITKAAPARLVNRLDELFRRKYIMSHSLPLNSDITYNSISPITNIEVYRTERAPQAWSEFQDELYSYRTTYPGSSNHIFTNKIKTNTPYYYMFRSVNSHGTAGQCSDIYKVELIQEGDVVYPDVTIYSMPTKKDIAKQSQQISKSIMRLLRIQPAVTQRIINQQEMSRYFSAGAAMKHFSLGSQVKYSIWDQQKFKIRLTSKQTGRKIDLNLRFKLNKQERIREPDDTERRALAPPPLTDDDSAGIDMSIGIDDTS